MGILLYFDDLSPLAPGLDENVAEILIEDIEAAALDVAPCLAEQGLPDAIRSSARSILRQAVLRWHRAGEGGLSSIQQSAGVFQQTQSFDTRAYGEGRLLASEIRRLRGLCLRVSGTGPRRKAFTIIPTG